MLYRACILLINVVAYCNSYAQGLNNIKQLTLTQNYTEAKLAVNNYLSDTSNTKNADAWYFKGYIYLQLAKQSYASDSFSNNYTTSMQAFKQCLTLQPKHKWLVKDGYRPLAQLYTESFAAAKTSYQNNEYKTALGQLLITQTISQYLITNNIPIYGKALPLLDTSLVYNIATVAEQANNKALSMQYYAQLASAKLNGVQYVPMYTKLLQYYTSINDELSYKQYLTLANQAYPNQHYWATMQQDRYTAVKLPTALLQKYAQQLAIKPTDYKLNYDYCNDLMQLLFYQNQTPEQKDSLQKITEKQLLYCNSLPQSDINTTYLLAQYYYKTALNSATNQAYYTNAETYALQVYNHYYPNTRLSTYQLQNLITVTEQLIEIYTATNNTPQQTAYNTALQEIKLRKGILPKVVKKTN